MFSGVMVSAKMVRKPDNPTVLEITMDQDLQNASGPPLRWVDHEQFYSGDTFSSYIFDLANGAIAGVNVRLLTPV
ncbi:MAG: hypothetical protein MI725_13055 [Pirellulales bacterium]|nr:hypothetical protein [Pirellulales bacterium]